MRHTRFVVGVALSALLLSVPTLAEERCSVELLLGGALNASTTLAINQDGEDDIEIDADYATKPFEFPVYYALRLAHLRARGAWEFQFIHHKIHLENTTEEIERFEITHGFNIFTVNRAFPTGPVDLRAGAGIVIAHADSRIRGLSSSHSGVLGTGYEFAGPAVLAGAGKRFRLSARWIATLETQVTLGWANVSIANGKAETTNVAVHIMFGVGYTW
ncbi:hypothetical protein KAW64_10810 [bacterium]|nr:hypothetical protein [bacterium]